MRDFQLKYSTAMLLFIAGYMTFGLGLSAMGSVKKLGIVFSVAGLSLCLYTAHVRNQKLPDAFKLFILFYAYLVISSIWSPAPALLSSRGMISILCASLMIGLSLHLKLITYHTMLLLLMIPGALNFIAYLLGINIMLERHDGSEATVEQAWKRFSGFIGQPNAFAIRGLLPIIFLATFFREFKKEQAPTSLYYLALFLTVFVIIVSGSKKAVIIGAIFILLWTYQVLSKKAFLFVSIGTVILALSFMSALIHTSELEVVARFQLMLSGDDESTIERLLMMKLAPLVFLDNFILGAGLNGFAYVSGIGAYAHNNALELAASGGLVGLLLYYPLFIICFFQIYKQFGAVYTGIFLVFYLFSELTSVMYMNRAYSIILIMVILLAITKGGEQHEH